MAEKWNKELDCDWLNYCKGLVTDCIPKPYICKKLKADWKEGENNYFEKKHVSSCKSALRVMILRKSKKISKSDCGFDQQMGFTDLWIIWLTTRSLKWRDGSGPSCFWYEKQKKKETGRTDLAKEPAKKTCSYCSSSCSSSSCSCGLGIMAGLLMMILHTTRFGLRIIILQIAK